MNKTKLGNTLELIGYAFMILAIVAALGALSGCAIEGNPGSNGAAGPQGAAGVQGSNGADGAAGTSCSVQRVHGGALITCGDGSEAIVLDGVNGLDGSKGRNCKDKGKG